MESATRFDPRHAPLYLPFGMRQRRGLVILARREGQTIFDPDDVSVGQQFALLASVALAMRDANEMETEGRLLRELIAQLRQSQQEAQHNADLLGKIMELLPVGLTVQGESGRLILVNGVAATNSKPARRRPDRNLAYPCPVRAPVTGAVARRPTPSRSASWRPPRKRSAQRGANAAHLAQVGAHFRRDPAARLRSTSPSASRPKTSWRDAPISTN